MRLTVETGPLAGTVVSLEREHPTVLGSGPDCAIRIPEAGVAPQHAVVKALKDQGFGIKALAPGLRVNGTAIEATPLSDGDVIELGTTRIAFGQTQKRGLPTIAGYRIIEELGRGGMGMVYRAEQVSLHREVALKVLNKDLTQNPSFVSKFVAEARAAAKLQHPNVVAVFDVEQQGELYYYAMELMHEGSLEDWLKQNGVMPVDRALRVVADAAAGLAYAESLGMVHRDIKPDNLMLDQHGAVKIADLGLANTSNEAEEKAVGTPHFMAPEQVLRKPVDHRSDLYSLGCTFYRLVTGRTPFPRKTVKDILAAQVREDAEPANKINTEVPAEVAAIIGKLMAKDPADRHQTANELLEDLERLLQPPAKKGLWIGLAAAAVLIAGGAIWWAATRPDKVIEIEKKYDDPEKQQFADEIKVLKRDAREATATIALLTARTSGLVDEALAAELDRIANDHPGTRAALEAKDRAVATRKEIEDRARAGQEKRTMVAEHLSTVRQAVQGPLDASDFGAAWNKLDAPAPMALRDDAELQSGVQKLREQVLTQARDKVKALVATIETARTKNDIAALTAACDEATKALEKKTQWPAPLEADVAAALAQIGKAKASLATMVAERGTSAWQQYHALLDGQGSIAGDLRNHDFQAAVDHCKAFTDAATEPTIAEPARALGAALANAATFSAALERAASAGQLVATTTEGASMPVGRWDRANRQFLLLDNSKKPAREVPLKTAALPLDAWTTIADQVTNQPAGARECFLGFVALSQHSDAAREFLGRVQAGNETSGTGAQSYPLGSVVFEQLLRRLPEADTDEWAKGLRRELLAGQRLAAGLRAFSERRNLAAASHVERLLAEYPHSFVVASLP